ncbi:4-dimethylallyltryptophan methyltransferase easF [Aspergillus alliaceus]|uniref:4-dimethylallyltryptophan methyltransferase easF n=1 Tax=Petromyces alliaceus TaxID=209559 RepID=UPI0012A51A61|nr:histidine-specific methyltransferase [Aspergillus alliaceus]KAB8230801.1 histidine-specific methyltransferase [Aspergillus alliaceus]
MNNERKIIDIRSSKVEDTIYQQIMDSIRKETRTLPILILYSTEGLQHWNTHSHAPDYYPRHEELHILNTQAQSIAESIENETAIVDLGSASLDKVIVLLDALEKQKKNVTYYALDLSHSGLVSTLKTIPMGRYNHVRCAGLHGSFEDGLEWIKTDPEVRGLPHCVLFLGSTIGNFSRKNAASFLANVAATSLSAQPNKSSILIGIDSCKVPIKVLRAYTSEGVVPFTMSGLRYASSILAENNTSDGSRTEVFEVNDWYYLSEWNQILGRHEASYTPRTRDIRLGSPLQDVVVRKGEKIRFGYSHKYDKGEREQLFAGAGVTAVNSWTDPTCDLAFYRLKILGHEAEDGSGLQE